MNSVVTSPPDTCVWRWFLRKLKIGLDFDDVIGETHGVKVEAAAKLFNVRVDPALFRKKYLTANGILSLQQFDKVQDVTFVQPVETVNPDALLYIGLLKMNGHELSIVTARSGPTLIPAIECCGMNEIDLPIVGVGKGVSKAKALRGFDVFFDDDAGNLAKLVGVVPYLFLHDRDFNRSDPLPHGVQRVNWFRFYEEVRQIAEAGA